MKQQITCRAHQVTQELSGEYFVNDAARIMLGSFGAFAEVNVKKIERRYEEFMGILLFVACQVTGGRER